MDSFTRLIRYALSKGAICLVFMGILAISARAQVVNITQPVVLSVDSVVTNGGVAVMNATITSFYSLKTVAWYCNGVPVPAAKCTVANVAVPLVGTVSTLTMTGVSTTNAGVYTLRATNVASYSAVSLGTTLQVQNIISTVVSNVVNVVSFVSAETAMTVNGFNIKLSAPTGSNVVIQASSDFKTWTPISTNLVSGGTVSYTDAAAKVQPLRYYRAFIQ